LQKILFGFLILLLPLLIVFVVPRLPKEVIGRPETDWLVTGINSPVITSMKQLEDEMSVFENEIQIKFGDQIKYTFTQIFGSTNGIIMLRLNSRKKIDELLSQMETHFKNTPTKYYFFEKWNPSELRIPDPPEFRLEIKGGSPEMRLQMSEDFQVKFSDQGIYENLHINPPAQRSQKISVDLLNPMNTGSDSPLTASLSHYLRTATVGQFIDNLTVGKKSFPIYMRFPEDRTKTIADLRSLPIGVDGRLISLSAFAQFEQQIKEPEIYRENQASMVVIQGKTNKANKTQAPENLKKALAVVETQKQNWADNKSISASEKPTLNVAHADLELREALAQLKLAVLISAVLVFLTMILQLGDVMQASLVMVAIPLGIIGVIISLFIFRSTLSLNSGLGTILLNGIAVANSIILVDFIHKLFKSGRGAFRATVDASVARLRPILMTSLTTGLGMLPIAFGMGEGGKILQPLGIAVCGGLWFSTLLTLYVVPALQFRYLGYIEARQKSDPLSNGEKQ
jgi:multidrug efflux pump subunit AcrB